MTERKGAADERYLIEAIGDNCPDEGTRDLIDFWFSTIDSE